MTISKPSPPESSSEITANFEHWVENKTTCPIEKPLRTLIPEKEVMNPATPSVTEFQIEIANCQTKRDVIKAVLGYAEAHGLRGNQDILSEEERKRFRENLERLP